MWNSTKVVASTFPENLEKKPMPRHILTSRIGTSVLVFVLALANAGGATTLQDCQRWIASASYRSREGLLQMFLQAARTDHVRSATLDRSVLAALGGKLETMFPLEKTESVTYADSVLEIRFREPVEIAVPGTWRQTHLSMSRQVRFRVRPWEGNPFGVEFEILQGSVRLDFGWLARKITAMPDHLVGRRLRYWSDDARKTSGISLEQETRLEPGTFRIERDPGSLRIDCPPHPPLAFTDTSAEYFGIRLVRRGDLLRSPDGKWRRDSAAARWLSSLRPSLSATIDSARGKPLLLLFESIDYRLEERKGSLSKGFRMKNEP